MAQRDRLIAQAQEEANRTVNLARDRSSELVERDQVVQAAYTQAEQIKAQAQADGEAIRREADEYVLETLRNLEMEMERSINQVRNGIRTLQEEKPKEEE
jgi:cell division septum initiation protein DivIVA